MSGIFAVICGQVVVLCYHYWHVNYSSSRRIQTQDVKSVPFLQGTLSHLSQPEGFILLGGYLTGTWMFNLMPKSYYSWDGGFNITHIACQLLINDFLQTMMHYGEHRISPAVYKVCHKPHHRFLNPVLFEAFNGSIADTVFMILIPLVCTAQLVHCNVWSYMAFGTIYSSWLTLIHSELTHPWDPLFRRLGFGTAGDHHVHHRCFVYNYGHLFTWWDRMLGTYKSPLDVGSFNKDI